jgi:hypothetical protein
MPCWAAFRTVASCSLIRSIRVAASRARALTVCQFEARPSDASTAVRIAARRTSVVLR